MPDNIYRFRRMKRADPKRFKLIAASKSKWYRSSYFSGLVVLCVLIGFVAIQAWPRIYPELKLETADSTSVRAAISVRVIDGDTIRLDDGRPNVRLVGYNAPETGSRARCEAER